MRSSPATAPPNPCEVTGNHVYCRFCRIDGGTVPDGKYPCEVTGNDVYRRFLPHRRRPGPDEKTMARHGLLLDGDVLELCRVDRDAGPENAGRRMRVDTTVVEAPVPIHHRSDSALCGDAVRVLSRENDHPAAYVGMTARGG